MMKEYESGALTTDGLRAKFQEFFLAGRELTLAEFEEGLASLLLPIPPHRIALVDRLRYQGYHCHVISNNTDLHTKHIRKAFIKDFGRSLEDSFERVFLSQEVHCRKPDKKIYELALREVGAKPEDSLMIDDLAANLVSPKTLGMHTLLVSPEEEVEDRMKATFIY